MFRLSGYVEKAVLLWLVSLLLIHYKKKAIFKALKVCFEFFCFQLNKTSCQCCQ